MRKNMESSSVEQQEAEKSIRGEISALLKVPVEWNKKIAISEGVSIEPDVYSDAGIIGEIYAHIGQLKSGQQKKISQDILKMLLLEKVRDQTFDKYIFVIDEEVEEYLKGKSFIAKSVEQFEIRVHRVDISEEMRCNVLAAQKRQYR